MKGLGTITVRAVGERGYRRGDTIFLTPDPDRSHLFAEDGRTLTNTPVASGNNRTLEPVPA